MAHSCQYTLVSDKPFSIWLRTSMQYSWTCKIFVLFEKIEIIYTEFWRDIQCGIASKIWKVLMDRLFMTFWTLWLFFSTYVDIMSPLFIYSTITYDARWGEKNKNLRKQEEDT